MASADRQSRPVIIPYSPREIFVPFHSRFAENRRFAVIVAHRRAGKTVACVNDLILHAARSTLKNPRFAYIAPFYSQAKDVAWQYLREYAGAIPGASFHEQELRCDLPNGARVRLYGADHYDRLRGLYFDGVVLDEYADMDPRAWSEVIRPALSDRHGWAVFIGTPKGRNAFAELYEKHKSDPQWFSALLRASETGIIDDQELRATRGEMTEDQYEQEYECSFDAAVYGAYYARLLNDAAKERRIGRVPHDPSLPVYTAWDLGIGDTTAIWFAQFNGREIWLIDYYENHGEALAHYSKVLKRNETYQYADHFLPHDAEARELGTGRTRVETLASLGIKPIKIAPRLAVEDGINAARLLLPMMWIDEEKCARGLDALRNYRAEYDGKRQTLKVRPLHDWSSHGADAFRMLAVSYKDRYGRIDKSKDYRPKWQSKTAQSNWANF